MQVKKIDVKEIKLNPKNPRVIREHKFDQLVQSIKDFPEMLELREIVVDEDNMILGGNMRFKACVEAGLKHLDVVVMDGLTAEQKEEFIIKDNANYGQWNWEVLANTFDEGLLSHWGLNVWQPDDSLNWTPDEPIDESIGEGTSEESAVNIDGKKVIQLEFAIEDYDEAYGLVTMLRSKGVNLGEVLIESMKGYVSTTV